MSNSLRVFLSLLSISAVFSNIADFDCFERADGGMGRAYFEVYAWQATNRTCTKFVYGGALGNRNRFGNVEECFQSCHDAILNNQYQFDPSRRYYAVNRLYDLFRIQLNIKPIDDGYFKLTVRPFEKVIGWTNSVNRLGVTFQVFNNSQTQHWDVFPTGEKDYYRIKTRTKPTGHFDYMFLQVAANDTIHFSLDQRENGYLGQQWRFFPI